MYFFVTWPALRPHAVLVEGNRIVPKSAILAAARVNPHTNMWLQDTRAMARRIEAIPYIETAAVHRRPPATLAIRVSERVPFARLIAGGGTVIVDRDLRVLQNAEASFDALPAFVVRTLQAPAAGTTLSDSPLVALRNDEEALAIAHLAASRLEHDKFGDLTVTLDNGVRVLFGDENELGKKLALVEPILTQVGKAGRPIAAIDLRAPNTPVVVYKK